MAAVERMIDEGVERRLIEGLRSNDREIMAELFDTYSSIAYGVALRILRDKGEAEDVVQESFLALWRQAERLDPSRGLRSYLLTIVHNRTIDRLRRKGRRPEGALELAASVPNREEAPSDMAVRGAEAQTVRAALTSLPAEQRRTVEMTYFGGLTTSEVANQMSVPVGTVKSRLRLALQHLRRRLTEA